MFYTVVNGSAREITPPACIDGCHVPLVLLTHDHRFDGKCINVMNVSLELSMVNGVLNLGIVMLLCTVTSSLNADDPANDFFENKVRPLLVAHCYECHSADSKKVEGGLRLDSRAGWQTGGDSGPAIVPGKPEESLLIKAIRYDDSVSQMPPKGKLSDTEIRTLTEWIGKGAFDPRDGGPPSASKKAIDIEKGREYWAFQPLHAPSLSDSLSNSWLDSPVDLLMDRVYSEHRLTPNNEAEPGRLIRRVTLDLAGIPPLPHEVESYLAATEPDRYERLIDRLLASPAFGERWGRHWLDVARFAESFGFEHDYDRPHAYHYRDFVIKSLNADMPYDQFVRWQIAGDEIAPADPLAMMATGFLGAGVFPTQITANEVERTRYDALDDMLSTVGSGFLGLSIGCARCHDHKFDPIGSQDYYNLLSTFTKTVRSDVELDLDPEATRDSWKQFETKRIALTNSIERYERDKLPARIKEWLATNATAFPESAGWEVLEDIDIKSEGKATFTKQSDGSYLASGENPRFDSYTIQAKSSSRRLTAIRIEALPDASLPHQGPGRAANGNIGLTSIEVTAGPTSSPDQTRVISLKAPRSTFDQKGLTAESVLKKEGGCWAIDPQFGRMHAIAFDFAEPITTSGDTQLTVILRFHCNDQHNIGRVRLSVSSLDESLAAGAPSRNKPLADAVKSLRNGDPFETLNENARQILIEWFRFLDPDWQTLHRELAAHLLTAPQPKLTTVMIAAEGFKPIRWHSQGADFFEKTYQLKRGDTNLKGEEALPGFLPVLARRDASDTRWRESPPVSARSTFRRRSMANWMTDVEEGAGPLVARVLVNRLWQHHLGRGIVATPNDFGTQGERPTHPELLEWLACELVNDDWRMKDIHRLIVTSATYRQSAEFDSQKFSIDPDNKYLWRFTPRRLEAESIRDSLFAVSGMLDRTMFGPGTLDESMRRRSIYFTVKRSKLIPVIQLFDGPDTLTSLGRRAETTTAPQALFFMNDSHLRQCAVALAETASVEHSDFAEIVDQLYGLILSRSPSIEEREKGAAFLFNAMTLHENVAPKRKRILAVADFAQVLFGLNETIYME
ncbi:PSD1 and planctomycete cytochrome C domain-containing protein [bacterium]|nr:PSD1 and planctomycete cytochrome C domain-containing protein [bacterium]